MSKVSVVIPTYNRCSDLKNCVESILSCDYEDIELIVVDNASTDDTSAVMSGVSDGRLKYIRSDSNLMATGGRILGSKYVSGEYILYIDDDNVIHKDMISQLLAVFESHEKVGLVAPVSLYGDNPDIVSYVGGDINPVTSRFMAMYEGISVDELDCGKLYETSTAAQNCFMIKKEVLDVTGGFDPIYQIMFDESDFGMRIMKAGYRQFFAPLARTIHVGGSYYDRGTSLRHLGMGNPYRAFLFGRNRNIFMRRYSKWYQLFLYVLIFMPLFTIYYVRAAKKDNRPDIAREYFRGVVEGLRCKVSSEIL